MYKLKLLVVSHWLLIIIIIIAVFFRFHNITETPPGLYPDEAMNGNNALEALATGNFKIFYPENNGREGLFINIQALSVYIFGNEPWTLHGVSAIFGILTVLGLYFLTKELFERPALFKKSVSEAERAWFPSEARKSEAESQGASEIKPVAIALLSAFFLATSFWHINFSRIGFRAIMAPFFLVWSFYFLLKSIRLLKEKCLGASGASEWKIFSIAVLAGLLYGFGFHSYIAYRATPLLLAAGFAYRIFHFKELRKEIFKIFAVFTAFSILAFSPLGIYFLKHPADFFGRTTQISVFNSPNPIKDLTVNILKTATMFNFSGDGNWRHNYAAKPELFWPVGILFIIGVIFGISVLLKKKSDLPDNQNPVQFKKFSFLMLFLWIIIASLPIVISNEGLPHALRAILIIPPVFILAGVGGAWLIEKIKNQISKIKITNQNSKFLNFTSLFYILIFTFCAWLIFNAYNTYFIKWGGSEHTAGAFAANYVEIGRELNALPKELPKYVIVEAGGADVRGIPMPTQTVMFMTDTFTPEKQKEKNIFYVLPAQKNSIPKNGYITIIK